MPPWRNDDFSILINENGIRRGVPIDSPSDHDVVLCWNEFLRVLLCCYLSELEGKKQGTVHNNCLKNNTPNRKIQIRESFGSDDDIHPWGTYSYLGLVGPDLWRYLRHKPFQTREKLPDIPEILHSHSCYERIIQDHNTTIWHDRPGSLSLSSRLQQVGTLIFGEAEVSVAVIISARMAWNGGFSCRTPNGIEGSRIVNTGFEDTN